MLWRHDYRLCSASWTVPNRPVANNQPRAAFHPTPQGCGASINAPMPYCLWIWYEGFCRVLCGAIQLSKNMIFALAIETLS